MTKISNYSYHDRFIGQKPNSNYFNSYSINQSYFNSFEQSQYTDLIRKNLFGSKKYSEEEHLQFNNKNNHKLRQIDINIPQSGQYNNIKNKISPVKILDVPNIKDDFYLNLIDWHDKGPIGIALNNQAYIYTPENIVRIAKCPFSTYISSLKFNESILAVGLSNGCIEIYDLQKKIMMRTFQNHTQRVSSICFTENNLISGSKDKFINFSDLRIKQCLYKSIKGHNGQVCSLKVKPDQKNIFASGANDSKVLIWDIHKNTPISTIKGHKGAVKAISWCPWKSNTIATAGGKNDRTLKIWDQNMNLISSYNVNSQISGLEWNSRQRCLISSHGSNQSQICVWNWQNNEISKRSVSKKYGTRVLNLIQSKQEDMITTLSSDQTLKLFQLNNQNLLNKIYVNKHKKNQQILTRLI